MRIATGTERARVLPSLLAMLLVVPLLSLLALAAAGCSSTRPPPTRAAAREVAVETQGRVEEPGEKTGEPDVPEGIFHRVEPGQTLWRIARAYGVSWEELARVNRIEEPRSLTVGTLLFVPGARLELRVEPYPSPPPEPGEGRPSEGQAVHPGGPLLWPVANGRVISPFGAPRKGRKHAGVDISGEADQEVLAAGPGSVVYSDDTLKGYGKMVLLDHGNGLQTLYAHHSRLLVRPGDRVEQGQPIARIGRTGNATAEHCHFEVRKEKLPVDPLLFFPEIAGSLIAPGNLAAGGGAAGGDPANRDR